MVWQTVQESPAVEAAELAISRLRENAGFPNPFNVKLYVRGETMPIENLRRQLRDMDVPSGEFLGEEFERKVFTGKYFYYNNRNRASGLDLFAEDALFSWIILSWMDASDGQHEGINLCITPTPLATANNDWLAFVKEWVEWILPHFEGAVTIVLCETATVNLTLAPYATASIKHIWYAR